MDSGNVYHGFLRARDGRFETFDAPGASMVEYGGTSPKSINFAGEIIGSFAGPSYSNFGFLRTPDGKFTTFGAPGATSDEWQTTSPYAINAWGAITGYFCDATSLCKGFLLPGHLPWLLMMR
jgi:hypothetical protein